MMSEPGIEAGIAAPGEYVPAGEAQGEMRTFSRDELAAAFRIARAYPPAPKVPST